ncbi:MAG: DUF3368 domain-containing protein [Thermoguttaceae bacterium]|jgi:predicted nucleic acid-binding protein|nr:DUF3368 domain-containing protein [Thermoguttaceae bacterium]
MIVVSDTSPIRALAFLEALAVLEKLFGTVVIPPAVAHELRNPARPVRGESPPDLSLYPFIEVRSPVGQARVAELTEELDRGESEAIVLAHELGCPAILVDEMAGREVAVRQGLVPLGTAGILLRAKRAGVLGEVRPLLDRLVGELGFFIADSLRHSILDQAGE